MARDASAAGRYSNRKSKALERRVAKEFREWTGEDFRRTPGSGGLNKATFYKVAEREFSSDLMSERRLAFSIEVKSGIGFSLDALLNNPEKCRFTEWWLQVCYDSSIIGVLPLLWFKPHTNWDWIALSEEGINRLNISDIHYLKVNCYKSSIEGHISSDGRDLNVDIELPNPYLMRWKDIKNNVDGQLIFDSEQ